MTTTQVEVLDIKRTGGIAGQIQYTATVRYSPREHDAPADTCVVSFVGSIYGDGRPIVMVTEECPDGVFVTDPGRFGVKFGPEWVRRFFGEERY